MLRRAERELGVCGSLRVRDETRRELRRLGARAEPRGPAAEGDSGLGSLTKRELEIATLATDRKTNREIAAELFLSGKTVESHMRHIFQKLGVSSRVEVARAIEHARRQLDAEQRTSLATPPLDPDAQRLAELGYRQELARGLRFFDNAAMGFATISPVVGLYAVVLVGTVVAGPAWVWVLPVALAGQCLLLAVYAELASEFPIAGGAYQWSRRLMGGAYGWLSGWVAICAYAAANTTIAYLGAPWALTLFGITPTANAIVVTAMVLVLVCAIVGALGIDVLGRVIKGASLPRPSRRSGSDWRSCSSSERRTSPSSRRLSAPSRSRVDPSAQACSPRWPSAAGCSSASTPASASPRRRGAQHAMSRWRSGSRCSASASS